MSFDVERDISDTEISRARKQPFDGICQIQIGREYEQIFRFGAAHPMTPEANRTSMLGEPFQSFSRG